jgi:hypothetical protein
MKREFVAWIFTAIAVLMSQGASAQFQNTIVVQRAFTVPPSNGSFTDAAINCPNGYDAVSGGLDNVNAAFFEITSHAPTFNDVPLLQESDGTHGAPNGWHASVINHDSSSHQAVISAVCTPASGVTTVVNSVNVTAATAGGPGSGYQESHCASGQVALAGGIDVTRPEAMKLVATSGFYQGAATYILDLPTGNNPAPTGWAMLTTNQGPNTGVMKVAAICSSVSGAITVISDNITVTANQHAAVSVSCPASYVAIGGGFDSNAVDWLIATSNAPLYPGAPVRTVDRADGQYGLPTGWFVDVFSHSTDGDRRYRSGILCVPNAVRAGDIDLNGSSLDASDGLLILRYLFGFTGANLTANAIGSNAQRSDPGAILTYLNSIRSQLDVDLNGQFDALTDGLMIVRYLRGIRGSALVNGVLGPSAMRSDPGDIATYLGTLFGP